MTTDDRAVEPTEPQSVDTWIAVARRTHDDLADIVVKLDEKALARTSGSREWDVAQVLGHLGSQAEIGAASFDAARGHREPPGPDFNPEVWARWDALGQREKADGFLRESDALVRRYEELDRATRTSLRVDLGFLPAPVDVATVVSMRVNEVALHAWDVKVVDDSKATVFPPAAGLLIARTDALIGFLGHADAIGDRAVTIAVHTTDPNHSFGLEIADSVRLTDHPTAADAELTIPAEAWLRLVAGRLGPEHTPAGVTMTGDGIGLDDLRRVFPGY
jgi:uncharacterized protein (TIGR03083 family)